MRTAQETRNKTDPTDHKMANFRGFNVKAGNRIKHNRKQTAAPTLHPAKISIRSHLLKAKKPSSSSRLVAAGNGAPGAS
jgi:hypothetical protein